MAARARWPRVPLALLAVASVAPDIVDLALAALHACGRAGLYSHSLPAATALAILVGAAAAFWWRSPTAGWVAAAMVLLHLPADYITGLKIVWPGGPIIGLNLYSHPMADFALEALVALAGWRYLRARVFSTSGLTRGLAVAALVATQAAIDAASYAGVVKPNGCAAAPVVGAPHAGQ